MKKTAIFIIISAAFIFSGCTNKESGIYKGLITLQASQNGSRATFDGEATTWEDGDALNVEFIDETSSQHLIFTTSDSSQGIFTSTSSAELLQHNYYVIATYPASSTNLHPAERSAMVTVGEATQFQIDNNDSSHIAVLDAMYGSTTAMPDDIHLTMNHTASVLKLNITNATQTDIAAIQSVKITAPHGVSLSGDRTVDFLTGNISGSDGSNTIELTIDSEATYSSTEPFIAWVAAAPFSIAAGEVLKFVVKADGKSYEIIKDFNGAKCDFEAGVIMETTLELSATTLMANEKSVTATFSDENGYPAGFPDKNATSAINGTYKFGDYNYAFAGNVNMYYSYGGLKINLQKSNDYGTIALPVIDGYALTKVIVKLRDTYSGRQYKIAITDGELTPVEGGGAKANLNQTMTYNLTGLNPATQYYLHAYVKNFTDTQQACDITSIEMTYSLQ